MRTLKKITLGTLAIVMAFGLVFSLSAFKNVAEQRASYTFYFDGDPQDDDAVRDVANWKYDDQGQTCENVQQQACTITVDENFVDDSGTPELLPTINLQVQEYAPAGSHYVTGSDDSTMGISNKLN